VADQNDEVREFGVSMGRHSLVGRFDNDAVVWAWPLTLLVAAVSVVLLTVGVTFHSFVPKIFPLVGVVGLIVAGAGRLGTAVELRYGDRGLPQPPSPGLVTAGESMRKRSTGRSSGIAYVCAGLGAVLVFAGIDGRLDGLFMVGAGLAMIVGALFVGPAARFVVTGTQLRIDTAFRRTSIPRRLIGAFSRSELTVRIELTDGDYRDIRVDSPLWDVSRGGEYRHNSRCQVRTMGRIAALMAAVPATAMDTEAVETHMRTGMIATAVLAAVASFTMIVIGTISVFGIPA